jgi:hypothetical protein
MPTTLRSYSETKVSPAQSRQDVEDLLVKVGAKGFRWASTVGYPGRESLEAVVEWESQPFSFRIEVTFEDERQRRRLMRALYWYLKTKIEAVQLGLVDLEHEFLPYLLTSEGRTVYDQLRSTLPKMLAPPPEDA